MRMNKCGYLIREGFRSIRTHRFMSFASVTIIVACLLIMGSFSLVAVNINSLIKDLESENEIVAFIDEDLTENQAEALQNKIKTVDNVASVEFVSREDAMKSFMQDYSQDLMEGIDQGLARHAARTASRAALAGLQPWMQDAWSEARETAIAANAPGVAAVAAVAPLVDELSHVAAYQRFRARVPQLGEEAMVPIGE